jgi:hypothetical protein
MINDLAHTLPRETGATIYRELAFFEDHEKGGPKAASYCLDAPGFRQRF